MSIFRESFPDFIQNQINLRQELISGDERSIAMRHLNSRSSWVRMSSSVNVGGSSDLAKENVLFNGSATNTKKGEYKINEGFGNDKGTYKKGPLGFRPMPGIDNISVKNRGAYGSLREVTVNFKCWDINQLEDLEVLYMRPGYTVLIEWGWSNYLSGTTAKPQLKQADEYYDILNIASPKTISEITKELREKIKNSQGNYDAMFGKVKNYSWSARTDGGYDCTTTIISIGEVIESLKLNNTDLSFNTLAASTGGIVIPPSFLVGYSEGSKLTSSYDKNFLAGVLNELYAYGVTQMTHAEAGESRGIYMEAWEDKPTLNFFAIDNPGGVPPLPAGDDKKSILQNNKQVYITLESLCEVLNNAILPRFNSPLKIRTKTKDNSGTFQNNLCIWNPLQVSVDPSVCVISSPVWEVGVNFKSMVSGSSSELDTIKAAEKVAGIGVPEKAAEAESIVNSVLVHMLDNQGTFSSIDEKNKVVNPIVNFISKGTTTKERQNLLNQLQISYEILRGYKKTLIETFPTIKSSSGSGNNIDGKLKDGSNPTDTYWTFSGLRGQKSTQKGILVVKTGAYDGGSYEYADTVNDDLIPYFKSSSNLNLVEMIMKLDNSGSFGGDDYRKAFQKAVGSGNGLPIGNDLTKQDDYLNAHAAASAALTATRDNKAFIKYLEKLNKKFNDGERGVIGNIYVNINHLYKKIVSDVSNTDRQEKNEISLYDFLKGVLKDIQGSIGNLNNFEVYVDDEHASIIDINFSGNLSAAKGAFKIQVQNKKSVVKNYSLQSQIFPEQSSMISIAAQANQDLLNTDSSTLKAYSRNITDRTLKVPPNDTATKYLSDIGNKYSTMTRVLSKIAEYFASTPASDNPASPSTTVTSGNEYKNALRDLIQFSRQYFAVPGNNFNVIIPTKLSITLDGLGGIIIGNLFKISDNALPKGYKGGGGYGNELGYIVTDISQDVKSGEWSTTIGAQTIVLDSPGGGLTIWDYNKLVIDINPDTAINEGAEKVKDKLTGRRPLSEYEKLYKDSIITKSPEANKYAQKIIDNKAIYQKIEKATGVPWYVIGTIHYRESGMNFNTHLHNGDDLSGPTFHYPPNRPTKEKRRFAFEESAIDALSLNGFNKNNFSTIPSALQSLECYNGLGYYKGGHVSPYVWAGTNQYTSGKYVRDRVYDPAAVDAQLGVAALFKALQSKGAI